MTVTEDKIQWKKMGYSRDELQQKMSYRGRDEPRRQDELQR